jgi:hypothetical protein
LLPQRLALGVRDGAVRVSRLHRIGHQRVQGEVLPHVPEEVLLGPPFEHPIGYDPDGEVVPRGQDRRLVAVVAEAAHLAHPQIRQDVDVTLGQDIADGDQVPLSGR